MADNNQFQRELPSPAATASDSPEGRVKSGKSAKALPCDEARQINANGDRPIDHLDSDRLDRHLENIYVFKLGLLNSFGVDFRHQTYVSRTGETQDDAVTARPVLFNYLSEVLPLVQPQANRLPERRRVAYDNLADAAVNSFWEIYYRFGPLIHRLADKSGVDVDDLGNILGRAILLYDKKLGFKFFSYLDKTLRESTKNLRGRDYAERFRLPQSAGRLMPQILWLVDQETLRLGRCLSIEESESVVLKYLHQQPARFSAATMLRIADAVRSQAAPLPFDQTMPFHGANSVYDQNVDDQDEYEYLLSRIARATEKAMLSEREKAILLQRLDLSYDEDLYSRVESELTAGSLRNRRAQLMVRFIAALHSDEAERFGKFLLADPIASKPAMTRALADLAQHYQITPDQTVHFLLNHLALVDAPFKVTIAQRGQLQAFLSAHDQAPLTKISGQLFHKLKAGLIDQDRQDFPCIREFLAD